MSFYHRFFKLAAFLSMVWINLVLGQTPDYFPLQIGNKWFYKLFTFWGTVHYANKTVEVADTTVINSKTYFVFDERIIDLYYEPGNISRFKNYYRKLNNGDIARFSEVINDEQLYYTFQWDSLNRPYLFSYLRSGTYWQITLIGTKTTVQNPSGTFLNCFDYRFKYLIDGHLVPESYFFALAPNIGLIDETSEGDRKFLVGAYLNGVVFGDTLLTSVKDMPSQLLPSSPTLYQNYPNPFHHETLIMYSIPHLWREQIEISILDLLGREIKTFISPTNFSGDHRLFWDGTSSTGEKVKNGVYLIKLTSGPIQQIVKICLMR